MRCATLDGIVQALFGTVVWIVCGLGLLAALISLVLSSRTWEEYGRDHLLMESRDLRPAARTSGGSDAERDAEIRQMLEARNLRRARRGEPPIDVEQELARLITPTVDAELREEIRQHVVARNHRRARTGKPPLDVESEVEREIQGLQGV